MRSVNPFKIIAAVEEYYHLPKGSIVKHNRSRTRVRARAVSVRLCRQLTDFTYSELGEFFERDHSSLQHLNNKASKLLNVCKEIGEEILTKL